MMQAYILYIAVLINGNFTMNSIVYDTFEACNEANKFNNRILNDMLNKDDKNKAEVLTYCLKK